METLEAEAAAAGVSFVDDLLLDFTPEDSPHSSTHHHSHHHRTTTQPLPPSSEEENPVDDELFAPAAVLDSFPALVVEEELEWLSNKDAFPTLETFDIPSHHKSTSSPSNPKRPSPVSVLESVGSVSGGGESGGEYSPPRVPVRARSKGRRRRRRLLSVLGFAAVAEQEQEQQKTRGFGGERRRCWHCEADETPQWRAGPNGPKTLCNACGVRYKSGRLVPEYRPANSPSFSSELHSNSHRKIMEMQLVKDGAGAGAGKKKRAFLRL